MIELVIPIIREVLPVLGALVIGFVGGIAFVWWILT